MKGENDLAAINSTVESIRILKERKDKLDNFDVGKLLLYDHASQGKFLLSKEQQVAVLNLIRNDINRQIDVHQSLLRAFGFEL